MSFSDIKKTFRVIVDLLRMLTFFYLKKNKVVAEYALQGMGKPIGIAEYELTQAIPDKLKGSLPTIKEIEKELE